MVVIGEAIFKGFPEPTDVVPQPEVYHATEVPEPPVTLRLIVPASSAQKLFRSTLANVGATGKALTVTVMLWHVEFPQEFIQRA